ncbi:MAG: hypothetical protein HUU26_03765 [Gemmatimonadaceae bacterium]|nr:hypothetical protein [Gemmatimonadaceae bacterium]
MAVTWLWWHAVAGFVLGRRTRRIVRLSNDTSAWTLHRLSGPAEVLDRRSIVCGLLYHTCETASLRRRARLTLTVLRGTSSPDRPRLRSSLGQQVWLQVLTTRGAFTIDEPGAVSVAVGDLQEHDTSALRAPQSTAGDWQPATIIGETPRWVAAHRLLANAGALALGFATVVATVLGPLLVLAAVQGGLRSADLLLVAALYSLNAVVASWLIGRQAARLNESGAIRFAATDAGLAVRNGKEIELFPWQAVAGPVRCAYLPLSQCQVIVTSDRRWVVCAGGPETWRLLRDIRASARAAQGET